ncbi:GNAT family N-acetyltransferase [Fredinandcohnia quinoae]|uniref:GNAT family N-acetyltransferase n=1 Tax=Fredinandcohnia quinoae TaxID=2918902 RepID=A0AAW5E3I8_9BACI|nr:GNAT family protein [Fredinandcohnia sp. SECRCQ15]MCH1625805.1 GNAT family N-acetyltransferase [Fredinandcohnia sp. SECRCQ15]
MLSYNLLKGKKLQLVRIREEDIATIVEWYEDQEFLRNLDTLPAFPKHPDAFKEWVEQKNEKEFVFGIRELDSNRLVGFVDLDSIIWPHRNAWMAIAIGGKENRGRGVGYEAIQLVLEFAFHELNLHRIQLTVFEYNERAIALYEKVGFKREGTYREFLERDGKRYDMYLYGLLKQEWSKKEA